MYYQRIEFRTSDKPTGDSLPHYRIQLQVHFRVWYYGEQRLLERNCTNNQSTPIMKPWVRSFFLKDSRRYYFLITFNVVNVMALDEDPSRLEYPPACNNLFTASSYFYFQELAGKWQYSYWCCLRWFICRKRCPSIESALARRAEWERERVMTSFHCVKKEKYIM